MHRTRSLVFEKRESFVDSWWFYPLVIGAVLTALALSTTLGYYWGAHTQPLSQVSQFKSELEEQHHLMEESRLAVNADLDALTHRIGMLQAHIMRINALGTKVVKMAKLKTGEFDFSQEPALGGADDALDVSSYESEEITQILEKLELAMMEKEQQLQYLDDMMLSRNLEKETKPQGRPVDEGWLSSSYGYRTDPFNGRRQFHKGVDFAAEKGTAINAVAGGIVTKAKRHAQYGWMVEIDHRNGYVTVYAHASELLVVKGDVVKKGQEIAKVGSTGRSTGPHLHFEVRKNGRTINPSRLLSKES